MVQAGHSPGAGSSVRQGVLWQRVSLVIAQGSVTQQGARWETILHIKVSWGKKGLSNNLPISLPPHTTSPDEGLFQDVFSGGMSSQKRREVDSAADDLERAFTLG